VLDTHKVFVQFTHMKLADYLAESGTTLQAFGAKVGVAHSTVLRWASGKAAPRDRAMFDRVAAATGGRVQAADFFPGAATQRTAPPSLAEADAPYDVQARALGLNPETIAEAALKRAVGDEKARRWAEENRAAIEAHARWIEEHDTPLAKYRMF
jgi:antitoxin CcdA